MNSLRKLTDANLTVITPLPAAGANVQGNGLDFLQSDPGAVINVLAQERCAFRITIPALPNNVSPDDSVTATFMDSADGDTWAPIVGLAPIVIPGVATTGSARVYKEVDPPPTTRRYVAANYAATSGAGDNTAASGTFQFAF